jgi:hypothetical protein
MGSAYGFGGIGKIIGPLGLALIVGSSNYLKPDVPLPQIPLAFLYLGCWFLMAGTVYYFFGIKTRSLMGTRKPREGIVVRGTEKKYEAGLTISFLPQPTLRACANVCSRGASNFAKVSFRGPAIRSSFSTIPTVLA